MRPVSEGMVQGSLREIYPLTISAICSIVNNELDCQYVDH